MQSTATTTTWLSPTDFVSGDPTLKISYPSVSNPSTVVTCTSPGDLKWISIGLRLPQDIKIEEVIVCYQLSNSQSFISQIRLLEMKTPDKATVIHDDGTDLQSTSAICYISPVGGKVPSSCTAVTLALRLNFKNKDDKIMLGAVGVELTQKTQDPFINVKDFGARGDGVYLPEVHIKKDEKIITLSGLTSADIGKLFYIDGAGDNYGTLVTTITDVSGSTVTLADSASAPAPADPAQKGVRGFYGRDDYAAIAAAISQVSNTNGGVVFFPQGTYAVSKTLEIKTKSIRLIGVGAGSGNTMGLTVAPVSELRFTGTGDGVFFDGGMVNGPVGGPNALVGCGIADLSICGTSHLTNCLRIRNTHHSHFARIRVADCTAAGLKVEFGNSNVYDHFRYSTNETPALNNALPTYGIHLSRVEYASGKEESPLGATASHFIVPIVEGAMNGYFEEVGSSNIVTSGIFGGCRQKGMIISRFAMYNVYSAIDLEENQVGDIEVQGGSALESGSHGHLFDGILAISGVSPGSANAEAGGINFLQGSFQCTVVGGQYYKIQIQGGNESVPPTRLITLVNARYMHSFTDNGTGTRNLGTAGSSGAWDTTKIPGDVMLGYGSRGAIKSHYQMTGIDVAGPDIDPNSRKQIAVPLTGSGIKNGDLLIATPRGDLGDFVSYYAYVSADDEVTIVFFNLDTDMRTASSKTWDFMSWRL